MSAREDAVVEALWPHLDLDSRDLEPGFAPAVAAEAISAADKVMFSDERLALVEIELASTSYTHRKVRARMIANIFKGKDAA
jgi:hypothetical protein